MLAFGSSPVFFEKRRSWLCHTWRYTESPFLWEYQKDRSVWSPWTTSKEPGEQTLTLILTRRVLMEQRYFNRCCFKVVLQWFPNYIIKTTNAISTQFLTPPLIKMNVKRLSNLNFFTLHLFPPCHGWNSVVACILYSRVYRKSLWLVYFK